MTNLHNPLPSNCGLPILCGYQNQTPTLQIIRITNIPNWYFERVVFPGEELILEALPEAVLEIYSSDEMGLFLREVLLGDWLRVNHSQYCSLKFDSLTAQIHDVRTDHQEREDILALGGHSLSK